MPYPLALVGESGDLKLGSEARESLKRAHASMGFSTEEGSVPSSVKNDRIALHENTL